MKNLNTKVKQTSVALLFTITTLLFFGSAKLISRPNFTGKWVINLSKSDFGDSPLYTAPRQLEITQRIDDIEIGRIVINTSGKDSSMRENISLTGKLFEMLTADKRTRHYTASWAENDETLKEEYSSSYSDNPDEEEYHTIEIWKLSTDGKELTLSKRVKVDSGYEYAVKAVYDKQ